jgi:hypothetical protein
MTEPFDRHLEPHEIAAYVDGGVSGDERAAIQTHLAGCAECRTEVVEVGRTLRTAPRPRRMSSRLWIPAAAAAVFALLWLGPRTLRERGEPELREEAVTMTIAPRPITPAGTVDTVSAMVWASVPYANSYRVRLFDADGTVIWEREAPDTIAPISGSIALRADVPYYWRVEAHTGFERWAASDLVEFRLQREARP